MDEQGIKENEQPYVPLIDGELIQGIYSDNEGELAILIEQVGNFLAEYTLQQAVLGKGQFSEVRKAKHKQTGAMRAVKIIDKSRLSPVDQEQFISEVAILVKLDHPNIIKVLEFYQDDRYFYIVQELCTGGELFERILDQCTFSEQQAAQLTKQILSGLQHCHNINLVHRDLRPENLLFISTKQNAQLKLIDFEIAAYVKPIYSATQALNDPWIQKHNKQTQLEVSFLQKALTNMKQFSFKNNKLQYALFKFIVRELVTNEEKEQFQKAFEALDLNKDGILSKEELVFGYKKIMKSIEAENEISQISLIFDKNDRGAIDFSEFITATVDGQNLLSKQRLEEAFLHFDKNGDGKISINDLQQVFSGISNEIWAQVVQEFDANLDGQLSIDEFNKMMQNIKK